MIDFFQEQCIELKWENIAQPACTKRYSLHIHFVRHNIAYGYFTVAFDLYLIIRGPFFRRLKGEEQISENEEGMRDNEKGMKIEVGTEGKLKQKD